MFFFKNANKTGIVFLLVNYISGEILIAAYSFDVEQQLLEIHLEKFVCTFLSYKFNIA